MRVAKINSTLSKLQKPMQPIKRKKDILLQKCSEVRHKRVKDLSTRDIPIIGALAGLFSPIPLGGLVGFGVGKLIELTVDLFHKNK